jgi:hypothetical protein
MYGAAEESDYEPPAKSQKIRTEATSAVAGEAILPRLAPQLARRAQNDGSNYLEPCVHGAVAYPRLSAPWETGRYDRCWSRLPRQELGVLSKHRRRCLNVLWKRKDG